MIKFLNVTKLFIYLESTLKNRVMLYEKTLKNYKFYLAMENSLCQDYITEKLFLAMHAGVLPIAYGGLSKKDYLKVIPPHSFIYAEDFQSVQELADYLKILATNSTAYNSYFWWKDDYSITTIDEERWETNCDLCTALNEHLLEKNQPENQFSAFDDYWRPENICRKGGFKDQN